MGNRSLLTVDLCGGLVSLTCLALGGWYGWLNPDAAGPKLEAMVASVSRQQVELGRVNGQLTEQHAVLQLTRTEAESRGLLPEATELEKDLGAVVALAQRHRLSVKRVSPLPSVQYPGILEQRYSIDADGAFTDWIAFLGEFQEGKFWVDITHIRLVAPPSQSETGTPSAVQLTVSFFSIVPEGDGRVDI